MFFCSLKSSTGWVYGSYAHIFSKGNEFFYIKDKGLDIIVQDTLLDQAPTSNNTDASKLYLDLRKLTEYDMKLQLHLITLSVTLSLITLYFIGEQKKFQEV